MGLVWKTSSAEDCRIPWGIALDVAGGKMYWTDAGSDKIQRANLDGSGVEDLIITYSSGPVKGGGQRYGLALVPGRDDLGTGLTRLRGQPIIPPVEEYPNRSDPPRA